MKQISAQGRVLRGAGWCLILLLLAWMPSCRQAGNEASETPVVVGQGDPLNAPVVSAPSGEEAIGSGIPKPPAAADENAPAAVQPAMPQITGASQASAQPSAAGTAAPKDYLPVSFAYLSSFNYDVPDPFSMKNMKEEDRKKITDQIPDYILKLDQKKVALSGFMVPIDVVDEGVKTFILTSNQMMCCFGQMPWYNEWVFVEMPEGKPATFHNDIPITVGGVLEIGEEIEDGFVISLFRMKGDRVSLADGDSSSSTPSNN